MTRMTEAPRIAAGRKVEAWHSRSAEEVLVQLGSKAVGLSAQEAAQRLAANGPNELKEAKRISALKIVLGHTVELTRFRGHLTLWVGGHHDAEEQAAIPA